ncbi:Aldo/keto reductase, partial [Schizopora paradoxa]
MVGYWTGILVFHDEDVAFFLKGAHGVGTPGTPASAGVLAILGMGSADGTSDIKTAHKALTYAADHGMTFWDTADIYGDAGSLRQVVGLISSSPPNLAAASPPPPPPPISPTHPISSPSYIHHALQSSLKRLKTTYIDLYYQHCVDPTVPIEVVLSTLRPYLAAGAIKWVGLSECSADTLRRAKAVEGVLERNEDGESFAEVCEELGVSIVAYSPLGRGMMSGRYKSRADFVPTDVGVVRD